jgi:uncharacterized membrane protein YagU involved in acid resistance
VTAAEHPAIGRWPGPADGRSGGRSGGRFAPARRRLRHGAAPGAAAGIAGGLVFGAAMASYGFLPTVAAIVRTESVYAGFAVHMLIAMIVGAGFGALVADQRARRSELLFWGLAYGAFWWFLGPQTLLPLLLGRPVAWDMARAQAVLPSLFGHLWYGAVTALVFAALRRTTDAGDRLRPATLLRGALAGCLSAGVLAAGLGMMGRQPLGLLPAVAAVLGVGYPLLFTGRREGAGPAVIRGAAYGFLSWIVLGITLPPVLAAGALDWSLAATAAAVAQLPAYLLLGAATAAIFTWLGALSRALFVDDVRGLHEEAPGARGLRATGHGVLAGLVGGLAFTVVMVVVDALPAVAGLVGARTAAVGLPVHLVISQLIGVSYALLFRRRSFDLAAGIGWGMSYGFLWWVLGALTLFPLLLGADPRWSAGAMAAAFPSLIGHLAYGAALGAVYTRLEARANPWWTTRSQAEAERVAARREQALGSAPALWVIVVLIALIIPLLVAG